MDDTPDVTERLRDIERIVRRCGKDWLYRDGEPFVAFNGMAAPTLAEAADEIESLRAQVEALCDRIRRYARTDLAFLEDYTP
jgi:hypothetical protein